MNKKSSLNWDWGADVPLSDVGGRVFLNEASQADVEAHKQELRRKFRAAKDAVELSTSITSHSDHRGQEAIRKFKSGVRAVELSNAIAHSEGHERGLKSRNRLKAAGHAIEFTNQNKKISQECGRIPNWPRRRCCRSV